MSCILDQRQRIEDVRATMYITGALRDISAIELKKIRERFEQNNLFYEELRELYGLMWRIGEVSGVLNPEMLNTKRTLHVAYTTNRHFYGALNHNVMQKFIESTSSSDTCLILGETGKNLWRSHAKKRYEISFLSFTSDMPTTEEAHAFFERTARYGRVFVYYPGFVSVYRQDARVTDITYRPERATGTVKQEDVESDTQYILEPEVREMTLFFNTQVRYILFERVLLETELSRVAARLLKMDAADQNARTLIVRELRELRRILATFSSRRMLEALVGFIQWNTKKE